MKLFTACVVLGIVLSGGALYAEDGTGRVFKQNPVYDLNRQDLRDFNDNDFPALNTPQSAYSDVPLTSLTRFEFGFKLQGDFVSTEDIAPSLSCDVGNVVGKPPLTSTDGRFIYNRSEDNFEHVMAYYHINRSLEYLAGLQVIPSVGRVRVDAHGGDALDAHYCTGVLEPSDTILYGDGDIGSVALTGGVDAAEDADVILHELGHLIQEKSSGGKYGTVLAKGLPSPPTEETKAMGEGFGDYWAFSNNFDQTKLSSEEARKDSREACWAEWWAKGAQVTPDCARQLDRT